jgi:hypothetical protein
MTIKQHQIETYTRSGDNYAKRLLSNQTGHSYNGDKLVVKRHNKSNEVVVGVLDGASSPYFYNMVLENTDAWSSRVMREMLEKNVNRYDILPPAEELVADIIDDYAFLCDAYRPVYQKQLEDDGHIDPNHQLTAKVWNPACAFVVAVFHQDGSISIVQATDCTISTIDHMGQIDILTPDTHETLRKSGKLARLPESPEESLAKGIKPETVLAREFEVIRKNRANFYNQPNGLGVFNGERDMLNSGCLHTSVISAEDLKQIKQLVLVSDGMTPDRNNIKRSIAYIAQYGADDYYDNELVPHFGGRNPVPTDTTSIVITL